MKRTEKPTSLTVGTAGLESTGVDSSVGDAAAAETAECTAEAPTGPATGEGEGVDSSASAGAAPAGPTPDATEPPGRVDPTAGFDRDATGDYDSGATEGLVYSTGMTAVDTEEGARSAEGHKEDDLPRITGYQILGVLGAGGMGIVYKARHSRLDRLVALKMIRAGAGARSSDLTRFEAEARAVAAIDHLNIIRPQVPSGPGPPPTSTRSGPRSTRCLRAGRRSGVHRSSTPSTWSATPSRWPPHSFCRGCPATWRRSA